MSKRGFFSSLDEAYDRSVAPDLSDAHPTNTCDGAALLNKRFAGRPETRPDDPPITPVSGSSVAAQLIATWFAPRPPGESDS